MLFLLEMYIKPKNCESSPGLTQREVFASLNHQNSFRDAV